jgi:hypothetical protein
MGSSLIRKVGVPPGEALGTPSRVSAESAACAKWAAVGLSDRSRAHERKRALEENFVTTPASSTPGAERSAERALFPVSKLNGASTNGDVAIVGKESTTATVGSGGKKGSGGGCVTGGMSEKTLKADDTLWM